jgi:hypothetical protein
VRAIALDGKIAAYQRKYPEETFTLSAAAERFHEMGYDLVASKHQWPVWGRSGPLQIEAELQTRCGCTRRVFVHRHQRTVRIACSPNVMLFCSADAEAKADVTVRDFEYWRTETRDGLPVAIYLEKA